MLIVDHIFWPSIGNGHITFISETWSVIIHNHKGPFSTIFIPDHSKSFAVCGLTPSVLWCNKYLSSALSGNSIICLYPISHQVSGCSEKIMHHVSKISHLWSYTKCLINHIFSQKKKDVHTYSVAREALFCGVTSTLSRLNWLNLLDVFIYDACVIVSWPACIIIITLV